MTAALTLTDAQLVELLRTPACKEWCRGWVTKPCPWTGQVLVDCDCGARSEARCSPWGL